jgi:hypothetical protein
MQFRRPESYRILQDPMGSGVGYVDLGGFCIFIFEIFHFGFSCFRNFVFRDFFRDSFL